MSSRAGTAEGRAGDPAGGPSARPVSLLPRAVDEHPLTPTQLDIWTSQRLRPDVPLANMGKRHRIRGPLDPERLVRAFDRVVRSAEALRTVVAGARDGQALARVLATPPATTAVVDLPAADLDEWCRRRIAEPVDATTAAYDSVLLRHADDDWTWWLDLHHVVTDAWSSAVVYARTAAAYDDLADAAGSGASPEREDDAGDVDDGGAPSFRAHVAAQAARRSAEERESRAAAWARERAEAGPPVPLTPYGPRGPATTRVERLPVPLDDLHRAPADDGAADLPARGEAALRAALDGPYRTLSRELSLLGLLVTTTVVALHRLDGRREVEVGVPIHHRSGPVAAAVIGPLMELYPLRVTVESGDAYTDVFERVRRGIVGVLRRAKPGERPEADFEVVVNVLTARFGDFAGLPTSTEWMRSGHVDPAHVIRVQAYDYGEDLRLELDLNDALSVDGAHRSAPAHLARVLSFAVEDPARLVGDGTLATEEQRRALARLNPPVEPGAVPRDRVVHEVIRDRLRAAPGAIVAEQEGREVTAADLDRSAEELARWLGRRGLGRGARIGLRMRRSVDVLAAVQGVLRAGAAFVVLDPDDPPARHDTIRDDAGLALVLDALPVDDDVPPGPDVDVPTATDTQARVGLDDTAYVLYTSGSTGIPKGVPIPHRGLADYLAFAADAYVEPGPGPVMPLHSALVFDLTITSLFLPLLTGGRTVVIPDGGLAGLSAIAADRRLTLLKATPGQLDLLSRMITDPLALRTVIVGGEAFRRPTAAAFAARCAPGVRIFNEYGPTEAVVGCMIHEWDPDGDIGPDVPIGRAAPGAEVFVLDRYGRPTPPGAWGELWVRRPGMPAGYLDRPALSAERFRPAPGVDDAPLYRTGDRARVDAAGAVIYGGRLDDQMKVNGIRLEPGEIEAALVEHPLVDNAVVRTWEPAARRIGLARCVRCGLGSDVPEVVIDDDGVCSVCRRFDEVAPQAESWFRTPADLDEQRDRARGRRRGEYDCLHLLSGGKDSTYALYQLVERGWRVHALTLDNGYIAEGAKENVRRTVADLGITHEFVTTEAMPAIFRDSLDRYANVCNGCYKTIYTLAVARAHELGIPTVVTGLSRGQFFETRLTPAQFEAGRFDPAAIDATVLEARRAYHRTADAVTELLPEQSVFEDGRVLDEIEFVDFYRYVDVDLADLYDFLERRAPWVRPADTGRSTNCLINAAGIYVHRLERGYHNYAEPYSWDVRLGHKTRAEALDELDDDLDEVEVHRMLAEIGYDPKPGSVLTAWYRTPSGEPVDPDELRRHLRERLPEHAVPAAFVFVADLPLAASAKIDLRALPAPTRFDRRGDHYTAPVGPTETVLCDVFATVLDLERVGADDDFFDIGGASLAALEAVAIIEARLGVELADAAVFQHRTASRLAPVVDAARHGSAADPTRIGVPEIAAGTPPPLSPGEHALLYEHRLDPSDTRYNVTRLYRLRGDVDLDRLEHALGELVALHGPLHTSYAAHRRLLPVGEALSFTRLPPGSPEDFRRRADAERRVPFDLDAGPLVRVLAGRTGTDEWSLLLGLHHISVDAGTFDTLWDQLARRYAGGPLPEPAFSYAAHGRAHATRPADDARSFWLEQRERVEATGDRATGLALEPPDAAEPDGYLHREVDIPVAALAGGPGTTPFVNALTATAVVLSRFRATPRVELGVTASTKDLAGAAPLVGYYLNTLPLVVDVDPGEALHDIAERTGELVADALAHRTYPFASMVRDARAAGLPLPDVSCMLAYEELAPVELPGAEAEHTILASGTSVADATFFVQERGDAVELGLEYRGRVVGRADAGRLLDAFEQALRALVAEPGLTVATATADGAAPDLVGPGAADADTPVVARLAARARSHPGVPAVEDATGATLTYGELLERAAELAARLRGSLGSAVGEGRRVGVALERRTDLVVAIVAAHLAGAAYVPVDPAAPAARARTILDIADPALVVVSPDTETLAGGRPALVIGGGRPPDPVDDAARDGDRATDVRRWLADVTPDDVAYVIFTSGSTGTPRGIEVSQRNLAASTAARDDFYDGIPARFLMTSSIGFDSSMVGLFWPLATGGTVVLPDEGLVRDVQRLGRFVADRSVTHLLMVPSLYQALLRQVGGSLSGLEVAIVAGEACPPQLVSDHVDRLPGVALVNEYGPSEATVWATAHRCRPGPGPVPIGRPVAGVVARVADGRGTPLPAGVAGELLIGGSGVTAGYIGDDEATAARFLRHDGGWYRTGDRVRTNRDGDLVFLGRVDEQLNVGGVRIEPVEIEAELREWPGVHDAVVVEDRDRPVLVAHLEAGDLDVEALRSWLAARLPATHVPRRLARHDALPRNPHGKLDREAARDLPTTTPAPTGGAGDAGADRTGAELVAGVWREVLGSSAIGPDTDYFDAGGDSLAAIEIVMNLGELIGSDVAIATLLAGRTPAGIARLLGLGEGPGEATGRGAATTSHEARIPLRPGAPDGPLVLLAASWDDVFGYRELADALPDHVRVDALVHLPDAADRIVGSVDEMTERFVALVGDLADGSSPGPVIVAGWSIGGTVAYALAHRLAELGADVALVAMVDTYFPGEERRIWSNRWWKYRSILRPSAVSALVAELGATVRRRAARLAERVGRRLVRWGGGDVADAPALTAVGGVPWTAFDHRPAPASLPVVLYAASTTNPARTERPWRAVAPGLEAVVVPGRHRGHDSIMSAERVGTIADDLARRLDAAERSSH